VAENCPTCGALPRLNRPLFDGERLQLPVEIMKLEPKKGEILVFRNLRTDEIAPLNDAIRKLREDKKIPDDFEVMFFESEVDPKYVPALREAIVQITKIDRLSMGTILIVGGLPLHLQRYLHITLRETGLMPPGSALVTLPEGVTSIEKMERPKLVELLNGLLGKKK
jgi:hypothetical protein